MEEKQSDRRRIQFSLQSLLLSFVVLSFAIGAFGVWGIAVAVGLFFIAIAARCMKLMSTAMRIVGLSLASLAVVGIAIWLLWPMPIEVAKQKSPEVKCLSNLIGLEAHWMSTIRRIVRFRQPIRRHLWPTLAEADR